MPRLLDLFCGAGGATRGYQLAGFEVWGIDNRPMPRYCGGTQLAASLTTRRAAPSRNAAMLTQPAA